MPTGTNILQPQCPTKDVCLYPAKLTVSIDDEIVVSDGESNATMGIYEMTNLDGNTFVKKQVSIGKENLVPEDWFEDKKSDDSDYDTPEPSDP